LFEREDWTLFRSLNTLGQKAGVSAGQIPGLVAKELADNALDASGDCRIALHGSNGFLVEDDGDGIPGDDEAIASLFSINRPLTSSKILRTPGRGALGNGLRVVAGAVLSTGGTLEVSTRGRTLELIPRETGKTCVRRVSSSDSSGCRVVVGFGPTVPMRSSALAWAHEAIKLSKGESWYKGRSSPHWYDSEAFYELLKASGSRTARELIAEMEGCAEPKAGKIAAEFKGRLAKSLNRGESDRLLTAARSQAREVHPKHLGRCGRLMFPLAGRAEWRGFLFLGSAASPIKAKLPVSIEIWAEFSDDIEARLSVNRTPITGKLDAWKEKSTLRVSGCGINIDVPMGRQGVKLWVNIDTPHMPITTDGKEPDLSAFEKVISEAATKSIRIVKRYSSLILEPKKTKKSVIIENIEAGAAMMSGDGQFRFAQRQLFYAIRPKFMEVVGVEPEWGYFCQVITEYEANHGDIPLMYRDPRGVVYHPHLGDEIPLGTLYVEKYERPGWLFNKVLYCEKEGFFSILKAVNWPERNDCALMTSKGFSGRAARDLIDLLAGTDEECQFFCIHDADASGTMIYQTLQEATKARDARKVQIVNLGLEPAEARGMGLQIERFEEKDKRLPVADYIPDDDREWLQRNRIELNAMTTPAFLAWLDRKFAPYRGKLIPPVSILDDSFDQVVRDRLKQGITRAILRRANLDERVERAIERRAEAIDAARNALPGLVVHNLERKPENPWTEPVSRIARRAITRKNA
jgi:hypothetical protein